jgi:hypothetical protein
MSLIFLSAALSVLVGFILILPAFFFSGGERADLPVLVDVRVLGGRPLSRREVFLTSLLLHLLISALAGGIYALLAEEGVLFFTQDPYTLYSILVYSCLAWVVAGSCVYPALGMGWFARREGRRVWLEMLVTHLLLGAGFAWAVSWYRPFFFG